MNSVAPTAEGLLIGSVFSHKRKMLGLTQGQLAKQMKIAQSTISRVDRGVMVPNYLFLRKAGAAMFEEGIVSVVIEIERVRFKFFETMKLLGHEGVNSLEAGFKLTHVSVFEAALKVAAAS